jgi:hypothetical protein
MRNESSEVTKRVVDIKLYNISLVSSLVISGNIPSSQDYLCSVEAGAQPLSRLVVPEDLANI